MDSITLTFAQYLAIPRLLESFNSKPTKEIHIELHDDPTDFVRVTFDAGWGTTSFDIDEEGNSAQVVFGSSEISC